MMNVRYTCEITFSDPLYNLFNHKEVIVLELPESTYGNVKKECYRKLSESNLDIPKEYCKINYMLVNEERL